MSFVNSDPIKQAPAPQQPDPATASKPDTGPSDETKTPIFRDWASI